MDRRGAKRAKSKASGTDGEKERRGRDLRGQREGKVNRGGLCYKE